MPMEEVIPAAESATISPLRVLFSCRNQQIEVGRVAIDPGLAFQKLQSLVGDMVGLSPDRISLFLVQRMAKKIRRKMPIEEGTDFAGLSREGSGVILVRLKGSRRELRSQSYRDRQLSPGISVLRRPVESKPLSLASGADESGAERPIGGEVVKNLQRRRYALSSSAAAYFPQAAAYSGAPACNVCSAAAKSPAPFHWCVHDKVISEGFRSTAGPIQRPPKPATAAVVTASA